MPGRKSKGLPRSVNSETREAWASTSPLAGLLGRPRHCASPGPWPACGKLSGSPPLCPAPAWTHQGEAVTGVGGGISGDTLLR